MSDTSVLLWLQITNLCLEYITYDPNYNYDEDDDDDAMEAEDDDEEWVRIWVFGIRVYRFVSLFGFWFGVFCWYSSVSVGDVSESY